MNRIISRLTALSAATLLMLPSCLGKGKDTPEFPSVKPLSTLTGKVEKRTITRLSATGTEERTEEVYRPDGGLLTKTVYALPATGGALQPIETTTNTYDGQGQRISQVIEKRTATGTSERTETKYTYRPFSSRASYVSHYEEYDATGRLVAKVDNELEGTLLSRAIRTTFDYSAGGTPQETTLRTNYSYRSSLIDSRTFSLVPDPKNPKSTLPLYHQEQSLRVDYYGRKLFDEVHTFDTTQGAGKQDLNRPNGATVSIYGYGEMGDVISELREIHGQRTKEELEADKEHKLPLLKLIDRYSYQAKYSLPNEEGFPTKMEVTIERGIEKTKTTYTARLSYTYFASPKPQPVH
ncbi:hypothetical protein [Porphyromonas sp.]